MPVAASNKSYVGSNNNPPLTGEVNSNLGNIMSASVTTMRLYDVDSSTTNWATFFGTLTIGSVITAVSSANPANT